MEADKVMTDRETSKGKEEVKLQIDPSTQTLLERGKKLLSCLIHYFSLLFCTTPLLLLLLLSKYHPSIYFIGVVENEGNKKRAFVAQETESKPGLSQMYLEGPSL